jgi:antitoxin PrlF
MAIAHSRLTAQGQISVPAGIRKKLGVGPGSVLEWEDEGDRVFVRRSGRYSFEDVHRVLFPEGPPGRRSLKQMKEGMAEYVRERHARGRY